ncbi:MAG TPA: SMI1/KNR4 family protein [Trebonia sp.]|jgi:cell wall assembly regulator SMI1
MLRLLREANGAALDVPGGHVSGHVSHGIYSVPFRMPPSPGQLGRALQVSDMQEEHDAVQRVLASLTEAGMDGISFKAEISAHGHATLWLFTPPPTVKPHIGFGAYPGTLVRYEGALPEPARRLPEPNPDARPHPSADPALLERVLRQRLPGTAGATEEELAATEARLGMPLPDELKALYRTMRAPVELREDDRDGDEDDEPDERELTDAMLGELLVSLDGVHAGDAATRFPSWHLAREAVITPPGAAVQQLVGSPGWIVFGDDHGDSRYAIDMTPGPQDWRALLDAKAVPDSLLAAEIIVRGNPVPQPQPDPAGYIALANEIIALWKGPQIAETVIDGQLE